MQPTPKLLCLLFCCSACGAPTDGEAGPRLGGLSSQTIGLAHGIACVDDAHAAVATNRDGLQIVRLTAGAEPTVVARLPADQKVDSQASFLSAPGRLYFFNQTYGMLHVVDTRDALDERNEHAQDERLTFVVDVDGVVASLTPGNDYTLAEPLGETISAVNALYEKGHRIVMFTARGSATGIDWRKTTEDQFARWGLRYHELHFGKPAADYYIDDRLMPVTALKALARA